MRLNDRRLQGCVGVPTGAKARLLGTVAELLEAIDGADQLLRIARVPSHVAQLSRLLVQLREGVAQLGGNLAGSLHRLHRVVRTLLESLCAFARLFDLHGISFQVVVPHGDTSPAADAASEAGCGAR
ncbi:hypothetical protein HQN59_19860 [Schlegelella sp. ID0723]|uniref:Uncharacterized protein n=1 Tax=Piscinibacter koreensis TaxID=2742824 RepID=A0A7Y6NRJ7_9BURK|nr:hypothetical protein [Schlegelella koreensis]